MKASYRGLRCGVRPGKRQLRASASPALASGPLAPWTKPRFRGVLHEWAFYGAIPLAVLLGITADGALRTAAAGVFGAAVVGMFGASALYHRFDCSPSVRAWLRRFDHAGIYGLIAGTYAPFGLLVLHGAWQAAVLAIVWSGALAAVVLKFAWVTAPKWLSAFFGILLGWVGVIAAPEVARGAGAAVLGLVVAGGLLYTAGAIVYARGRPDPFPTVFGYHEVFHACVILAVALQYAAVALVLF